ncbi:MAG TPA: septal ring lytic transglycosylase RlpA family protein [Solirubrobacteraceae bacterium]|nr:septal ring lytic transglycosylase RlpA family protein [Solirubrobacteraceae bacterium]
MLCAAACALPAVAGAASPAPARSSAAHSALATWYGPGLYGHRTACGQTLSHRLLGVAHRRLPCGTPVQIAYAGRTIIVPVVDRGPWSGHAKYDLTYAAAKALGMAETERVTVAWLSPGAPLTAPAPGSPTGGFSS